jgi:hypothetical protein
MTPADSDVTALRLVYEAGSDQAPDDPFGHCRLELRLSGEADLVNRSHGRVREWRGAIAPDLLEELNAHLQAAGFPVALPPTPVTPGATAHRITVESSSGTASTRLYGYAYRSLDGYREAIPLMEATIRQLSQDSLKFGRPSNRVLVFGAHSEA